jgi:hypothetical protein
MALQLLGLDDGTESSDRNPVPMRGAYLSFLCVRHLRIRELQVCGQPGILVSGVWNVWLSRKEAFLPFRTNAFSCFCFSFQFLAWNEPLLRVVYSYLHSRADLSPWGSLKLYSVGWSEAKNRGLSLSFFVSAHLLRSSELFQICWANFDNQYFGPYYGCRKPGPHHGRWYLGKHGKRRLGHL